MRYDSVAGNLTLTKVFFKMHHVNRLKCYFLFLRVMFQPIRGYWAFQKTFTEVELLFTGTFYSINKVPQIKIFEYCHFYEYLARNIVFCYLCEISKNNYVKRCFGHVFEYFCEGLLWHSPSGCRIKCIKWIQNTRKIKSNCAWKKINHVE